MGCLSTSCSIPRAGLPAYNDAREAYGLTRATSFADITSNDDVRVLLEDTYGGDIDLLDAYTGALAEVNGGTINGLFGDLLQASEAKRNVPPLDCEEARVSCGR